MTFVQRRRGSYALIVSYRKGGKVKLPYVRTSTWAEAVKAQDASQPETLPTSTIEGAMPPSSALASAPPPRSDTMPPPPLAPVDTTRARPAQPPLTGQERCRMCGVLLSLGGITCRRCVGAMI